MAYVNRGYGNKYYEAEREVIREGPYGSYAADYNVDEYGNRIHHHRNGLGNVVTEIVSEVPAHHHHHHLGVPTEIIDRREHRIVDAAYDPYRRMY